MQGWTVRRVKQYSVYAYIDPRSNEIFYVGKDSQAGKRSLAFKAHPRHCLNIINKVERLGMKIVVVTVQDFDYYDEIYKILNDAEIYWIAEFRRRGCPLVNITDGGGGVLGLKGEKNPFYGKKHSQETKDFIGKINSGRKQTEEMQQKKRIAMKALITSGTYAKAIRIKCVEDGKEFQTIQDASDHYGIHYPNVADCITGRRKHARGLHFTKCDV